MDVAIAWAITALVGLLLAAFVLYLVDLRHLPVTRRPRTPTYDRLGGYLGMAENPDYRENPGEERAEAGGEERNGP